MMPIRVHREISGQADAPALVLANSLGCTVAMWDPQVEPLASRYRVIRYDMRGHGRSPSPPGPYSIADLGGDLIALLDELDIDRAHICGLSLGGMVGMWVAANAPDRVDRLALCATSARLGPPGMWAARAETVLADGLAAITEKVVARWFTPGFAARCPELVTRMHSMFESNAAVGYAGCCQAIETMDLLGDLPRIVAPTLVLAGADDPAIPIAHEELIAATIPDARLEVVPDGAHLLNIEQAPAVTALIREHLDQPQRPKEPG